MTWTLNQQSRRLADDKEQLSRALADISHQIRTPLTSVNLMAERMRRPDISEEEWRKLLKGKCLICWGVSDGSCGHPFETFPAGCRNCGIETRGISGKQPDRRRPADVCSFHGTSWSRTCIADESEDICISGDYTWTLEALQNVMKKCAGAYAGGRENMD